MKRVMFVARPSQDSAYLSACPPGEVLTRHRISMLMKTARHTVKDFPSPVRLVAMSAGRAGDARPRGMLGPDEDVHLLSDLQAACTIMLARPAADTTQRFKVAERLWVLYHERFTAQGCQRDSLSRFAVEQLLDRRPRRFLTMSLFLSCTLASGCLVQQRTQRLALVPIRSCDADVYTDITGQHVSRQHRLDLRELDKDAGEQAATLSLSDFTSRPKFSATAQGILERSMRPRGHPSTRRRLDPVRISCPFRFLNRCVTEQGEIGWTPKRGATAFLGSEAGIDDATRTLLCLVRQPAQACCTLGVALRLWSLGKVLRAILQRICAIPVQAVPGFLSLAGVRLNLDRVGTCDAGEFRSLCHTHCLGTSQYGDLHFPHRSGFCGLRGYQTWPQRRHVNCGNLSAFVMYFRVHYKKEKVNPSQEKIIRSRGQSRRTGFSATQPKLYARRRALAQCQLS